MATKKKQPDELTPIPKPPSGRKTRVSAPAGGQAQAAEPQKAQATHRIAPGLLSLAVPIGELIFDPANARKHPEGSVTAIASSLRVYGQVKPVVVKRDTGVVIAGNGTLAAALDMGWTHLAAVKVDMDGATAAGFAIADNRTAELSSWDKDALDKLLREVSTGNDPRLDEMMSELATSMKLVPAEEKQGRQPGSSGTSGAPAAGEPYQPVLDPAQAQGDVTPEDVADAQEDLAGQIADGQQLAQVICPKCAEEFSVDPSLLGKDYNKQ